GKAVEVVREGGLLFGEDKKIRDDTLNEEQIVSADTNVSGGLDTGEEVEVVISDPELEPVDPIIEPGTETPVDETEIDTGYTTDESGNRICNQVGYIYDVATDACVPAVEEEESTDTSLNIGSGASRSFEDVLKNIQTKATTISPISANIKPMAQGGMAGLNRTADNFLRALGG
ncbi:MAG TPA: hypothetical protein DCE52_14260, partial [Rhodobacteraceae bacterium]|nr:hypothetical protein [Paracoccaceae bacterium]